MNAQQVFPCLVCYDAGQFFINTTRCQLWSVIKSRSVTFLLSLRKRSWYLLLAVRWRALTKWVRFRGEGIPRFWVQIPGFEFHPYNSVAVWLWVSCLSVCALLSPLETRDPGSSCLRGCIWHLVDISCQSRSYHKWESKREDYRSPGLWDLLLNS